MGSPYFLGVGMAELLTGRACMVTGLEDQPDGSLKVYVGARYRGLYFVTDDAETQKALRVGWAHGGHLLILTPPADVIEAEA